MKKNGNGNLKATNTHPTLKVRSQDSRPTQAEMDEHFRIEATPEELVQALIKRSPKRR